LNLESKLRDLLSFDSSVEEQWVNFRDAVQSASLEVFGPVIRHHQDWFDDNDNEIETLLEENTACSWPSRVASWHQRCSA